MITIVLGALSLVALIIAAVIWLDVLHIRQAANPARPTRRRVPGPLPSDPRTGNAVEIGTAGSLHKFLAALHALYGPLVQFHMGQQQVFSAASPEMFRALQEASNRPGELFQLFSPLITEHSIQYANDQEGRDRHRRLRGPFHNPVLYSFYGIFAGIVSEYIETYGTIPRGERVNVTRDMFHIAMKAITRCAFGDFFANPAELELLRDNYNICWAELEQRVDMIPPSPERLQRFDEAKSVMYGLIERCIEQRQNGDLAVDETIFIDCLLAMERSPESTLGEAMTFLVGGFHTTGNLLTWVLYFISINMDIQDKIAAEAQLILGDDGIPSRENFGRFSYTHNVVKEALRCSALAPWAARYLNRDIDLGGYTIPARSPIITALGVVLHDPVVWPSPERFDPDRFTPEGATGRSARAFEPFGLAGRRCPGADFARSEVLTVLLMLCRRFRFRLASNEEVTKVYGFVTHPSRDIEITLEPR